MSTFKKALSRKNRLLSPRSYHHGDLAQVLKTKTLEMLKTKGLAGLNLRDLAKECHVTAAAVYRHYKSKEHLLAILAEEGLSGLQQKMLAANNPKRLQKMALAYVRYALKDPLRFRLGLDASIDKSKFPSLLKKHQQTYAIVRSEVANCVKNGNMEGNIDILTYTAWAVAHGIAMLILERQLPNIQNENQAKKITLKITAIVERGLGMLSCKK